MIQDIQARIDSLNPNRIDFFFNSPHEKVAAFKMLQEHLILYDLGLAQEKNISNVIENWLNSGSFTKGKDNQLYTVRETLGTQRYTFTQGKKGDTSSLDYVYDLLKETRKKELNEHVLHSTATLQ